MSDSVFVIIKWNNAFISKFLSMTNQEKTIIWERRVILNKQYDEYIMDIIKNNNIEFMKENIKIIKDMQQELFDLEKKIFKYIE